MERPFQEKEYGNGGEPVHHRSRTETARFRSPMLGRRMHIVMADNRSRWTSPALGLLVRPSLRGSRLMLLERLLV